MEFKELVNNRRSIRNLKKSDLNWQEIEDIVRLAQNVPSAFNMQAVRIVLAKDKTHEDIWDITLNKLLPLTEVNRQGVTKEKIAGFKKGQATLLIYLDRSVVKDLEEKFPLYADKFSDYAQQEVGMFQYVLWLGLVEKGLAASLQHYNPLIDNEMAQLLSTPDTWQLVAQMPIGIANETPSPRTLKKLEEILLAKKE